MIRADSGPGAGRADREIGGHEDVVEGDLWKGQRPSRPCGPQRARGYKPGDTPQRAVALRPGRGVQIAGQDDRSGDTADELNKIGHLLLMQPRVAARPM